MTKPQQLELRVGVGVKRFFLKLSPPTQNFQHRLRVGLEPIEDRALGRTKGGLADATLIALIFLTVAMDVAAMALPSGWTVDIRTEDSFEVHRTLHLVMVTKKCACKPLFFQIYPVSTLYCHATTLPTLVNC
jgi:hypothetical protein